MPRMTGGHAVVRALKAEGVEVVFGLPGVHIMDIYDGFFDNPEVRLITCRHEQSTAYKSAHVESEHGDNRGRHNGADMRSQDPALGGSLRPCDQNVVFAELFADQGSHESCVECRVPHSEGEPGQDQVTSPLQR